MSAFSKRISLTTFLAAGSTSITCSNQIRVMEDHFVVNCETGVFRDQIIPNGQQLGQEWPQKGLAMNTTHIRQMKTIWFQIPSFPACACLAASPSPIPHSLGTQFRSRALQSCRQEIQSCFQPHIQAPWHHYSVQVTRFLQYTTKVHKASLSLRSETPSDGAMQIDTSRNSPK